MMDAATAGRRKAAAITAAVDAIEGEPGQYVTGPVRAHLAALYDQAAADTRDQENPPMTTPPAPDPDATPCAGCQAPTGPLEMFPGGLCLACWAQTPEGRRMPTAGELTAMWGGPVRRGRRSR